MGNNKNCKLLPLYSRQKDQRSKLHMEEIMKSSNVFKKVLQDSGYDPKFDTIREVENEEVTEDGFNTPTETELNPEKPHSPDQPSKRPVSPKRLRKLSQSRKISVPKEVWLHKTPRKHCEVKHVNKLLNRTLSALLQRTNSLTQELNRGRIAIESSLDANRGVTRNHKTSKAAGVNPARVVAGKEDADKKRRRNTRPVLLLQDETMQRKTPALHEVSTKDKKLCEHIGSPRKSHAHLKDSVVQASLDSSFPPPANTNQVSKKPLKQAMSLPNLTSQSLVEKPRSKSFNDATRKKATGKTFSSTQARSHHQNGLITLCPPPSHIFHGSSSPRRCDNKDDIEILDSRSKKSSVTASSSKNEKR